MVYHQMFINTFDLPKVILDAIKDFCFYSGTKVVSSRNMKNETMRFITTNANSGHGVERRTLCPDDFPMDCSSVYRFTEAKGVFPTCAFRFCDKCGNFMNFLHSWYKNTKVPYLAACNDLQCCEMKDTSYCTYAQTIMHSHGPHKIRMGFSTFV